MSPKSISSLLIFSGLTLLSCSKTEVSEAKALKSYKIDLESELTDVSDLMLEVELIVLEETPESLFGYVGSLYLDGEELLVISSNGAKVRRFSKEGDLVSSFGHQGQGHEEYTHIDDILVQGDLIFILDSKRRRITKWTKTGEFAGYVKLDFAADHFLPFGEGFLFDNNYRMVADTITSNVVVTDKNFVTQKAFIPFPQPRSLSIGNSTGFNKVDKNIHYRPTFTDTVFSISPDFEVQPAFRFDFGKFWRFDNEYKTDMELMGASQSKIEGEMVMFFSSAETDQWLLGNITLLPTYRNGGFLIDKKTQETAYLNLALGEDRNNDLRVEMVDDNRIYSPFNSDQLEYLVSNHPDLKIKVHGAISIEQALQNENPMILSFKLKAGFSDH